MVKRAYISVDLEGMPYIVSRIHLSPGMHLWNESREIMTRIISTVSEHLHDKGFKEIIIADSHGGMVNIIPEKLPEYTYIVRGYPRPLSMISASENCNIALLMGYHAGFGTIKATFDHTYSGTSIRSVEINNIIVSEYLINAMALGDLGVPIALVAGDEALKPEVGKFTPWAVFISLKRSLGRYSAISPSISRILGRIKNGIDKAVKLYEKGGVKPLKIRPPITTRIVFQSTAYADLSELLPNIDRVDATTIEYKTESIIDAYKIMELLVIASSGIRAIIER